MGRTDKVKEQRLQAEIDEKRARNRAWDSTLEQLEVMQGVLEHIVWLQNQAKTPKAE